MADSGLITEEMLAVALNISVDTVRRYTRENKIPYVRLENKEYLYKISDVIDALPIVREQETKDKPDPNKFYTYQDYLLIPDEPGYRYEVLEGALIRDLSPTPLHQFAAQALFKLITAYFRQTDPGGIVFFAPLDITLGDATVVQPDILYIAAHQRHIILQTRIDGAPALTVEILSPATCRKDRIKKLQIYQKAGVQHYWLVGPEERTFQAFVLKDGIYALAACGDADDIIEHPDFPGLSIALCKLWMD